MNPCSHCGDKTVLIFIQDENIELGTKNWSSKRGPLRDKSEGKDLWIRIRSKKKYLTNCPNVFLKLFYHFQFSFD